MADDCKGKPVSIETAKAWPIYDSFKFEMNQSGTKYIRAECIICSDNLQVIRNSGLKGKALSDSLKFATDGTSNLALGNLKRHVSKPSHFYHSKKITKF